MGDTKAPMVRLPWQFICCNKDINKVHSGMFQQRCLVSMWSDKQSQPSSAEEKPTEDIFEELM
ncbi:hypothetical protein ABKV19_014151 [Rosa sericea]